MKIKAIVCLSLNCISYAMESNYESPLATNAARQRANSSHMASFVEEYLAIKERSGYLTQQEQDIMRIIESYSDTQASQQLLYYSYRTSTLYAQGTQHTRMLKQLAAITGDEAQQSDADLQWILDKFYGAIGEYNTRAAIIFKDVPDHLIPSWRELTDMMLKVKAHEPLNYLVYEITD